MLDHHLELSEYVSENVIIAYELFFFFVIIVYELLTNRWDLSLRLENSCENQLCSNEWSFDRVMWGIFLVVAKVLCLKSWFFYIALLAILHYSKCYMLHNKPFKKIAITAVLLHVARHFRPVLYILKWLISFKFNIFCTAIFPILYTGKRLIWMERIKCWMNYVFCKLET